MGVDFVSTIPSVDGVAPYTFTLDNSEVINQFITIDSETGEISILGSESEVGNFNIDITVGNDNGDSEFKEAFKVSILELEPPLSLSYEPSDIVLEEGDHLYGEEPSIKGVSPFTFSIANENEIPSFISIDPYSGRIIVDGDNSVSGDYLIDIRVINADGGDIFHEAYSIQILKSPVLLAGDVSKTWKFVREGFTIGIGPNANSWTTWWIGFSNTGVTPCVYKHTFTFYQDGTYTFDDAGTFWGYFPVFTGRDNGETCFDATAENMINNDGTDVSPWLSGTHSYSYNGVDKKITLYGEGAWIGMPHLGTSEEVSEPETSVTFNSLLVDSGDIGVDTLFAIFDYGNIYFKAVYVSYDDMADEPDLVDP